MYSILKAMRPGYSGHLFCAGKKVDEYQSLMPFGQVSVVYHVVKRVLGEHMETAKLVKSSTHIIQGE